MIALLHMEEGIWHAWAYVDGQRMCIDAGPSIRVLAARLSVRRYSWYVAI